MRCHKLRINGVRCLPLGRRRLDTSPPSSSSCPARLHVVRSKIACSAISLSVQPAPVAICHPLSSLAFYCQSSALSLSSLIRNWSLVMWLLEIIVVLSFACQATPSSLPSQPMETLTLFQHESAEVAPKPTEAPSIEADLLFKRQYPPTICGYYSCEFTLRPTS
jgi:hypothetical protein